MVMILTQGSKLTNVGLVGGTPCRASPSRKAFKVQATSWDPEGMFKAPPQTGIIDRKLMGDRVASDQEYKTQVATFIQQQKDDRQKRRDDRTPPTDPHDLVEYFLNMETEDMEYECARCRPLMSKDFFAVIDKLAGVERLSTSPDEDRLAELDALREYLTTAVEAVDTATKAVAAAPERFKKLMMSKDKKATLLEMAGSGEIDQPLMDLMDQNIEGAKAAGQEEAAEFMTKVQAAARRFLVVV